jgi:LCP family protein required for cell wall assembly
MIGLLIVGLLMFAGFTVLPGVVKNERPHRSWFQRAALTFTTWMVIVAVTISGSLAYLNEGFQAIPRVRIGEDVLAQPVEAGEPQNFLLVGVDSAEGLDPNDPVTEGRPEKSSLTDAIMVLRTDPEAGTAHLLSFPRDLWIPIAGTRGKQRINSALSTGGPEMLIRTIEENFGIPIHHYVQVDFKGFRELVNIVDGVPMYFSTGVRDRKTGLGVEPPPGGGCVTLDAEQALAFVRSRAFETREEDGWDTDPTGDLGRISRQQQFIRQALSRAIDKGFRNPSRLDQELTVAQESLTLDQELTARDLVDLGSQFTDFDEENFFTYSLPVEGGSVGGASVVFLVEDDAKSTFDVFRGIAPALALLPAIRVGVLNGTGNADHGTEVLAALADRGFSATTAGDAESFDYARTQIRYGPGQLGPAIIVARYLDAPDPEFVEVPDLGDETVVVVTGRDLTEVLDKARPVDDFEDKLPPELATTTVPTTNPPPVSTTVVGKVPEQATDC